MSEEDAQKEPFEETTEEQNNKETEESVSNNENYDTAEQCIMSELTECENIEANDQYQAYDNLIANGSLPQAPISDCLPCAVNYSFEAEYGDSREIDTSVLSRSVEAPVEINNQLQFVRQYAFSLPGYFNDVTDDALGFYHPDTAGYSQLVVNKSDGRFYLTNYEELDNVRVE